nr:MAG TPA: hypothetical protein [Caudoviricetes sp.]
MLIRSQNRETIVNVDATNHIFIGEVYRPNGSLYDVCADEMRLGYYLTKTTAMKVLDMIQETYKQEKTEIIYREGIYDIGTFQMPEDSEVEV